MKIANPKCDISKTKISEPRLLAKTKVGSPGHDDPCGGGEDPKLAVPCAGATEPSHVTLCTGDAGPSCTASDTNDEVSTLEAPAAGSERLRREKL